MRARVLAPLTAVLLVLLVGVVPTASADALGPAVFGPPTFTPATGSTGAGAAKQVDCPAGTVLTTVTVGLKKYPRQAAAASAGCAPVTVDEAVSLGKASRAGTVGGTSTSGGSGDSACPAGSVVVGFVGTSKIRRSGVDRDLARSGGGSQSAGVDALQMICRALNPDGTLAQATTYADEVGKADPYRRDPDALCPTGAVATGIAGTFDSNLKAETLYSFKLRCQLIGFPSTAPEDVNLTWATALPVGAESSTTSAVTAAGQERWFRFPVQPGQRVSVRLSELPEDYDLVLFKDIAESFTDLTTTDDLTKLSAEFAGDAYSPSVFSPSVFSPSVFSPSVFSPSVFSPSVFSPSVFSPSVFSPSVFSPSVFSPSVFSPSVFSPSVFSPAVSLPSVFSPSVFSPSVFSPSVFSDAFASAQTRSLIAVSANDGRADEHISSATWNNTGDFYLRVQGRNGVHSSQPFQLSITTTGGVCEAPLDLHADDATLSGTPGSAETVILTDPARLPGTAAQKVDLAAELDTFADRVDGAVVDLGDSAKVSALNAQADSAAHINCPYAKNLVAEAARDIVNSYRDAAGTLKYVVVVGDDSVVPFFRYPDAAGLGPEMDYSPPVSTDTASEASLRGNYVLGQDAYGSQTDLSVKGAEIPMPDLSVGRLVEKPEDITDQLARFVDRNGAALTPSSTLATGYDFLTDAADAVHKEFTEGVPGGRHDTLITDADVPPTDTAPNPDPRRRSWTADDLRTALLGTHHDMVFLAGHFSANNALAADYTTTMNTTEITDPPDLFPDDVFADSLVFSAGCHSGYTIVAADGVPQVTVDLDWTEAFAKKGATLIAGTGYQYGDTDFLAYSEQLYADFSHQLRIGSGAVPVGNALVAAKQRYLRTTASLGGIDQKAVLEATLYGLPMLGVDLPQDGRVEAPQDTSVVSPTAVTSGPGNTLGLRSDDIDVSATLQTLTRPLTNLDGGTVTATYLTGPDGTSTSPGEPALPLADLNVTAPGQVLRGVGLRSASYTDTDGITPLTGAPATETHSVHGPFVTPAFYPNRLARPNYFDALTGGASGTTRLMVTPAQHRSDGPASITNTLRRYSAMDLRLFYSSNIQTYGSNTPALAAPPGLTGIDSRIVDGRIDFSAHVTGDPSAGIQQVWVTYTSEPGGPWHGRWQSLDLTQNPDDSTLWTGSLTLPPGQDASAGRFLVQAVNGVGLVGTDDNQGDYFTPGVRAGSAVGADTTLTLDDPPATTAYGDTVTVQATLTEQADGRPLADRAVTFSLGAASRTAFTDSSGVARIGVPVTVGPGSHPLLATYIGDSDTAPATSATVDVTVRKQATSLTLTVADGTATATLIDAGEQPLREKAVYVAFIDGSGAVLQARTVITDLNGQAKLDLSARPAGATAIRAWFGESTTPVPGGQTVDLSDPLYGPGGPVTADLPAKPTARPDSYDVTPGTRLTVPRPGVLGNDDGATSAVLVEGPSVGDLTLNADGSFSYLPPASAFTGTTFTYRARNAGGASEPATVTLNPAEPSPTCTITGTPGRDVLNGTNGDDVICGLGGDDVINGSNGNDTIYGGDGNDTLNGSNGNDTIYGDAGNDTINGSNGNDTAYGGSGDDTIRGSNGNDTLVAGTGTDRLYGENGDDALDVRDDQPGDLADGGLGRDTAVSDAGDTVTSVP